MRDWAGHFRGDCFDYVMVHENITSFNDVIYLIARDFNLIPGNGPVNSEKTPRSDFTEIITESLPASLQIKRRNWNSYDVQYWKGKYNFKKETLLKFNVSPVERVWLNDKPYYHYSANPYDLCYAYHFGEYIYKIYFPLRKERRFIHNDSTILQGYDQLTSKGDILVITKSYKDVMKMYEYNINAVAPMSETIWEIKQWEELNERFLNKFVFGDHDAAGRRFINTISSLYNIPGICSPFGFPKDFTDLQEEKGDEFTTESIDYILNRLNYG